jgi:hypothetical protein
MAAAAREFLVNSWSQYRDRVDGLNAWPESINAHWARIPHIPMDYTPSPKGGIALNLALFTMNGCLVPLQSAPQAMANLWQAGLMQMISLPVRYALEAAGGVAYARWVWDRLESTGDIDKAGERVARLLMGARSDVQLPWGDPSTLVSINVMDFVDKMTSAGYVEAKEDYAFLCESCHPSFIQLVFWNIAGAPDMEFSNPLFDARMATQLERTVSSLEKACKLAANQADRLLVDVLPFVESDQIK